MVGVRQAVPHRHTGPLGKILHHGLLVAPVLDAVKEPAQHLGAVLQRFLFAHLGRTGVQIGDMGALLGGRYLKGTAGAGGGLFKQQHDVLPLQPAVGHTGALHILEIFGQVQQITDLRRGIVQQLQKASSSDIHSHDDVLPFY